MIKTQKIIVIIFIILVLAAGGFYGCQKSDDKRSESRKKGYQWIEISENYQPEDIVEEFIKNDAAQKDLFPVYIRNYGNDKSMLRKFNGKNFAGPNRTELEFLYSGLEDWKLIDIKFKRKDERQIQRTVLYVKVNGTWKVGDNGRIKK